MYLITTKLNIKLWIWIHSNFIFRCNSKPRNVRQKHNYLSFHIVFPHYHFSCPVDTVQHTTIIKFINIINQQNYISWAINLRLIHWSQKLRVWSFFFPFSLFFSLYLFARLYADYRIMEFHSCVVRATERMTTFGLNYYIIIFVHRIQFIHFSFFFLHFFSALNLCIEAICAGNEWK